MNCPACNTPGAYVGFTSVECVNAECEHFRPPAELLIKPPETPKFIQELKRERAGVIVSKARTWKPEDIARYRRELLNVPSHEAARYIIKSMRVEMSRHVERPFEYVGTPGFYSQRLLPPSLNLELSIAVVEGCTTNIHEDIQQRLEMPRRLIDEALRLP